MLFIAVPSILSAQTDTQSLDQLIGRASFEFSNEKMYRDEAAWKGKIVSVSGVYVPFPVVGRKRLPYIQIVNDGSYGPVNVVVYLDSPLPTTQSYGGAVPLLSTGESIRLVGEITGAENFVDRSGYWLYLPAMNAIAMYRLEDQNLRQPLWVSKAYRRQ